MKKPEELKQVTEDMLAGLSATEEMKKQILYKVANDLLAKEDNPSQSLRDSSPRGGANGGAKNDRKGWLRFMPALCCCLALVVCASVLIPKILETAKPDTEGFPQISEMVAGNYVVSEDKPVLASTKINTESMKVTDRDPKAGIFMNTIPGAESAASAELQLAVADGKFYRLTGDIFEKGSLELGSEAGEVTFSGDYTELLDIDTTSGSTFLADGTKLWFIEGMNKSFVTAEYEGKNVVFERVSIENRGLLTDEKLEDIIPDFDHVVRIEFSNRESITDAEKIREIGSLLKEYATMENSGAVTSGDQMILIMDNGIRYQFVMDGERICSCGTWVCPEFFEFIE